MQVKLILSVLLSMLLLACTNSDKNNLENVTFNNPKERVSYAIGADYGVNVLGIPDEAFAQLDIPTIINGFLAGLEENSEGREKCEFLVQGLFSPKGMDTSLYKPTQVADCYGFLYGDILRDNMKRKEALELLDLKYIEIGFTHALNRMDTLIPLQERNKMVMDFNNDVAAQMSQRMIDMARSIPNAYIDDKGFILVTHQEGDGEVLNRENEFRMVFTLTSPIGDTIVSTIQDPTAPDSKNAQIISADELVVPNGFMDAVQHMRVGGSYTVYVPFDLAFGEQGLFDSRKKNYVVPPNTSVIIHATVLSQGPIHGLIRSQGEKVIAEAKKRPNTIVGQEGYVLETLVAGSGGKIPAGSDVKAHYILSNAFGEEIENSYLGEQQGRGIPAFPLSGVIKGWQLAVPQMQKGGKYRLYLPYDIAYGENGTGSIPPYSTLIFEMEIIDFGPEKSLTQR
ncbi:MAG: FKBP-type peptidyl-prolyl cis-trans isomerase [Crocinitomicaceae bacterium]|nr:FKBP-type peptidyl-prolyl cis-trans isomerase [Crocinitomicaceae bacterium]